MEPTAPPAQTPDDRTYASLLHLAGLVGFFVTTPYVALIVPLIMWLIKKDQSRFIDAHGRAAVDFQISLAIYALIGTAIAVITCGIGLLVLVPLAIALLVLDIVFCIQGALAANRGDLYSYPLAIRFLGSGRSGDRPSDPYGPGT